MANLTFQKLKADGPPPLDYLQTHPDYRHTDKYLGLIMTTLKKVVQVIDNRALGDLCMN